MYIEQSEFEEKLDSFIEQSYELCLLLQCAGQWKDAIRLLLLGIDWTEDLIQKARLQIVLGEIYTQQGRYDEAEDVLGDAHFVSKQRLKTNIKEDGRGISHPYGENTHITDSNNSLGAHGGAPLQMNVIKCVLAKALLALGELQYFRHFFCREDCLSLAMGYIQEAKKLFEELGDFHSMAAVLAQSGIMADYQGNEVAARDYFEQAIALADKLHYEKGQIMALTQLGLIYQRNGDFEQALYYHEQALDMSQRVGQADRIMQALGHIGMAKYQLGCGTKMALSNCQEALKIAEKLEHKAGMCLMLKRMAHIHFEAGNHAEARDYFEQIVAIAAACNFVDYAEEARHGLQRLGIQ